MNIFIYELTLKSASWSVHFLRHLIGVLSLSLYLFICLSVSLKRIECKFKLSIYSKNYLDCQKYNTNLTLATGFEYSKMGLKISAIECRVAHVFQAEVHISSLFIANFFFLLHAERFSTITRYYQAKDLTIFNKCYVVSKRYRIYLALKWAIIFKAANRINFDLLLVDWRINVLHLIVSALK